MQSLFCECVRSCRAYPGPFRCIFPPETITSIDGRCHRCRRCIRKDIWLAVCWKHFVTYAEQIICYRRSANWCFKNFKVIFVWRKINSNMFLIFKRSVPSFVWKKKPLKKWHSSTRFFCGGHWRLCWKTNPFL